MFDPPLVPDLELTLQRLELHFAYMANPFAPRPGICSYCHGANWRATPSCPTCNGHHASLGRTKADFIVPISYALDTMQHARNLRSYKQPNPSDAALRILTALFESFLDLHFACLCNVAGGSLTHYITVPTTKNRTNHPLDLICASLPLRRLHAVAQPGAFDNGNSHRLDLDGFKLPEEDLNGQRILVIEDTWAAGARVQSLAHLLKRAGAKSVIAVVLGRWVSSGFDNGAHLVEAIKDSGPLDPTRCVLHQEIPSMKLDPFGEDVTGPANSSD